MMNHESNATPMIQLIDASLGYAEESEPTLAHLNLTIYAGEMVAVIGPNGAGKSTLLKTIVGLIPPYDGQALLHGVATGSPHHGCVSYVPQREAVDWNYPVTVRDVVMMGRYPYLSLFARVKREDRVIVRDALERMGLTAFADRRISDLSGGQQQRIFLARAFAQQPRVLLMDEPFNAVDLTTEKIILDSLHEFHKQGVTTLVVTHDLTIARDHFEKILLLNDREIEYGDAKELLVREKIEQVYGKRSAFFQGDWA